MKNVMYPITRLAGHEGKPADVIHAIAAVMMEHRAGLLSHTIKIPKSEERVLRKQARLLEEYAAILEAVYYQLEPERWDPDTSKSILELAQVHKIALPDWMVPDQQTEGKATTAEPAEETIENALNRYENEGGRNSPPREYL